MKTNIGKKLSENEICPEDLLKGQIDAYMNDIKKLKKKIKFFVNVSCPSCSEKKNIFAFRKYGFSFRKCKNCETIYMSPRPSEKIMEEYYSNSENYKYWAKYIFPRSEDKRKNKIHKLWLDRIKKTILKYNHEHSSLLEIGSGFGTFGELVLADTFFKKYVGIEPTPELALICQEKNLTIIRKKLEDVKFNSKNKFDVVVSFEVIEHIFEPGFFLKKINGLMNSNGLLFLSCPNGKGFDIEVLKEKSQAVDSEHVNLFNPRAISILLEKVGFKVISVTTPGRLDAEIVREVALRGEHNLDEFLSNILIKNWKKHGWSFQKFLAENNLSSHMWTVAKKI